MATKKFESRVIRLSPVVSEQMEKLRDKLPKYLEAQQFPPALIADMQGDSQLLILALDALDKRIESFHASNKRKR